MRPLAPTLFRVWILDWAAKPVAVVPIAFWASTTTFIAFVAGSKSTRYALEPYLAVPMSICPSLPSTIEK